MDAETFSKGKEVIRRARLLREVIRSLEYIAFPTDQEIGCLDDARSELRDMQFPRRYEPSMN